VAPRASLESSIFMGMFLDTIQHLHEQGKGLGSFTCHRLKEGVSTVFDPFDKCSPCYIKYSVSC
jgi:hypothetical protein